MERPPVVHTVVAWVLVIAAIAWVALLAGFGSELLSP
jgi:hypothetical protein